MIKIVVFLGIGGIITATSELIESNTSLDWLAILVKILGYFFMVMAGMFVIQKIYPSYFPQSKKNKTKDKNDE